MQFAFVPPTASNNLNATNNAQRPPQNGRLGQLLIKATVWYEILDALEYGFDLTQHLFPYSQYAVKTQIQPLSPSDFSADDYQNPTKSTFPALPIPNIPSNIDNLEKLFYWAAMQYSAALANLLYSDNQTLPYTFNGQVVEEIDYYFPASAYPIQDSVTITPYDNSGSISIAATFAFEWADWIGQSSILNAL